MLRFLKRAGFDFAFFVFVTLSSAPFNPPHRRSTLNFPRSMQNIQPIDTPMLFFPVYRATDSRLLARSLEGLFFCPSVAAVYPVFRHHFPYPLFDFPLPPKSFRINTCKSVTKQTTSTISRINTYEKHRGEGGTPLRLLASLPHFTPLPLLPVGAILKVILP
jgi:hypothetical protein